MKIIVILATAMCVGSVIAYPQISDEQFKSEDVNPETEDRANEVQQAAESQKNEVKVQFADEEGGAEAVAPLTPLDEVENEDDENRNKRFLSSLGGLSGSGSSGSGSGNFLFDILRVVAGSGSRLDSSSPGDSGEPDGVHEAVPGPVTRLFVIANRGIANLIQDLILRLAATSERIVNFKARLITSII